MSITLGLPVVPLEKQNKASFFFASPGFSRLSVNRRGPFNPSVTKSWTLACEEPGTGSKSTTRPAGSPTMRAASRATERLSGWTIISLAFVASN